MNNLSIQLDVQDLDYLSQINRQVVRVVHERDHYTCFFCGLRSLKYQQILICDKNWRDIDAIKTLCIFCRQCFTLDSVEQMRSGILIGFPDIEQPDLNRLAIEIYVARLQKDQDIRSKAITCHEYCKFKYEKAIEQIGTDKPGLLAQRLKDCKTENERSVLYTQMKEIRLFPLDRRIIREAELEFNQFPQIMAYWRSKSGPYSTMSFPRLELFFKKYCQIED